MVIFLKKKNRLKGKGFFLLSIIYVILLIADILISNKIKYIKLLELNPLMPYGGLITILIYNLIFAGFMIYWYYSTKSIGVRYYIIFLFVVVCLFRVFAIWNNLNVIEQNVTYEQALSVTEEQKDNMLAQIAFINLFPLICGIITWLFFKMDHAVRINDY